MSPASRLPIAALVFGVAAAFSAWNPLGAPFGLVVGIAAAAIALRASVLGSRKLLWVGALVVSLAAVLVSALVLARTAGVGRGGDEQTIVSAPDRAEIDAQLDAAEERTRAARERAVKELESLEPSGEASETKR
jgi:hypothetical protein